MNKIPAGYRTTSVSWENDADNYRTIIREGLSKRETELLGKLAKLLIDRSIGLENEYDPPEEVFENAHKKLWPIFDNYKDVFSEDDLSLFKSDIGQIQDYIQDNILGPSQEGYALRVLESFEVEYVPQDISLQIVTSKFLK